MAATEPRTRGRLEDGRLVRGLGQFTTDVAPPGSLTMVLVRSPVAHGTIRGIDATRALAAPGVAGVWTGEALVALGAHELPCEWLTPGQHATSRPLLATDRVRYVGDPVAAVLATDLYRAIDAAELVELDIEELPAVVDLSTAAADGGALLHPTWGTNVFAESIVVEDDIVGAFETAPVTTSVRVQFPRIVPISMEGRAAVAVPDAGSRRITAWLSTQAAHHAQRAIAHACGWRLADVHVVCPDVGGSFGLKEYVFPEDALVCFLARVTGRPVRWTEQRSEAFLGGGHARESAVDIALAADDDGHLLALDATYTWDAGAHPGSHGLGPARAGGTMLTGPYRVPAARIVARGVVTNKPVNGGFRGYGAPQGHLALERALDRLASRVGISGIEVRRRNLHGAATLPSATRSGVTLDDGDYLAGFDRVVAAMEARPVAEAEAGERIGQAVIPYVMLSGLGKSSDSLDAGLAHGSFETAQVRIDEDGGVELFVGTSSQGQGHETMLAEVAAEVLGIARETIRVRGGDTDVSPYSPVSAVGSRGAPVVAGAARLACAQLIEQLRPVAASLLDVDPSLVDYAAGAFREPGGRQATIGDAAGRALSGRGRQAAGDPVTAIATFEPERAAVTFGAHGVTVAVDTATGQIRVIDYVALDDCGPRINPAIVRGQIVGAIVQGLGAVLLEGLAYSETGQPLTRGLDGYLIPVAATVPPITTLDSVSPSAAMPRGVKGVGEAGIFGPAAGVAAAVDDALGLPAPDVVELPLSPAVVLRRIEAARAAH